MLSEWQVHKTQLKSYIDKQLDDPSSVDDILQEVYIKASENLHQLKVRGCFKSWLYRITHNLIMDYYRHRKSYDELPESVVAEEKDPVEENHNALATCIRPLIRELPDKYRIPLEYAELEGMGQQEIADKLGLSLSGAKSRVQRGRQKLKEIMLMHCDYELANGSVAGCIPRTEKGKEYYESIRKRFT
ncbi:RNA polymerase sigma factor SigZ [Thalassomonas viridans]|uniref:RNA polymerase sigma factor SigZ n=1 Tax=Thalassomonas viridans TaxID=137584 RepID=A0AAE9Z9N7_9GAMM|nr:RNA polymerase sigma factor SigZ [Thalassomonas viridans]WDE08827.1 RNA polymerase sigma factor SigZ [Thalassomonas viridans]